jgi:8-oxo-dGTP pyrophosphatase MutT (NUDIX family)
MGFQPEFDVEQILGSGLENDSPRCAGWLVELLLIEGKSSHAQSTCRDTRRSLLIYVCRHAESGVPLNSWKLINSRYVVRDRWMTLRADHCETAGGVRVDPYYVQEPPDWVHIVALDRDDRILIIRQYRHGARLVSTELPCGTIECGETPVEAAQRELLEETGCAWESVSALPILSPNPACYANRIHAFVATGTRRIRDQDLEETEEIEFEFLSISDVLSLVDTGAFPQALHTASLLLALREVRRLVANI